MDIAIVTTAYNGYGRFVLQWCRQVSLLLPAPRQVVVALGPDHGFTDEMEAECRKLIPGLVVVTVPFSTTTMGEMRHWAVQGATTEWVMYLSVDDGIFPYAIEELARFEKDADYICVRWMSKGLRRKKIGLFHTSPLPENMGLKHKGKGFVVGHSPFRRSLYYGVGGYVFTDYPNAPFLAAMVEAGARFVQTERPVTIYQRRKDSHSRAILFKTKSEKVKAIRAKRDMEKRIREYYRSKNRAR